MHLRWPGWPSLPLLGKELIEQSNRRRTFVIRTAYALLLYITMVCTLAAESGWNSNSLAMLGRGENLFHMIVAFQFFAIYAFLPGLAAGVISAEKERDTLAMLLLTKLNAWTIIWEKLLSRLMPLAMLLLLSMPLLAVAYSLGGVEATMIIDAVWVLAITALQVGALTIFCSTWFRTTAGAFIATYVIGFLILGFPLVMWGVLALLVIVLGGYVGGFPEELLELTANFFGPYVLFEGIYDEMRRRGGWTPVSTFWQLVAHMIFVVFRTSPLWITALGFLGGARGALWPRAFVRPQQRIMKFLRWVDGVFNDLNQNRVTKGVVLIKEASELPAFRPISWRETTKKALGTSRYLVRFLTVVEPILIIFLTLAEGPVRNNMTPGTVPNIILWIITSLAVTVLATGLIAGERSRQTLDVLLATPIPTQEILRQKLAGVRKVAWVMAIPLLTVLIFDLWVKFPNISVWRLDLPLLRQLGWQLAQGIAPIIVYPAIVAWVGFHCGMRMRNQGQAMLMTLALIVAWLVVPAILHGPPLLNFQHDMSMPFGSMTFSPVLYVIPEMRESAFRQPFNDWRFSGQRVDANMIWQMEWNTFAVHFGSLLVVWLLLRWRVFATFGRLLKRNDGQPEADPAPSERVASAS